MTSGVVAAGSSFAAAAAGSLEGDSRLAGDSRPAGDSRRTGAAAEGSPAGAVPGCSNPGRTLSLDEMEMGWEEEGSLAMRSCGLKDGMVR